MYIYNIYDIYIYMYIYMYLHTYIYQKQDTYFSKSFGFLSCSTLFFSF